MLARKDFLRSIGALAAGSALPASLAACATSGGALRLVGVTDQKSPLDELVRRYRKVKIKASYAPTDQVQTSLRTQLGAGNAPDVHVVDPGNGSAMAMVQIAKAGLLADLSGQRWTAAIPDRFKSAFNYRGKTLMYSAGSTVIGAIYNKRAFARAGVKPPKTWPALLDVCAKLKKAGTIPIALGAQTPWVTQLISYAIVPSTVYAHNPRFDQEQAAGKASFAGSGWAKALQMYLDLQHRGYFNDNPNGTTFEQQTSMVATGRAAMAVQVSAVIPDFRKAATNAEELGMFVFPGADRADDVWIAAGIVVGLGASVYSRKPDAAKAFIAYLGEPANMNRWAAATAAIPLQRQPGTKIDPVLEPFLPLVDSGRAVPFMDQNWPNAELQPAHFAVIQDLLAGRTDVHSALATMDKTYRNAN